MTQLTATPTAPPSLPVPPNRAPRIPLVVGGITVQFTPQQNDLFSFLLLRPGRIFTSRELLSALNTKASAKLIDVLVCRINRTLRDAFTSVTQNSPPPIQINAHWGLGHSLTYGPPTAPISPIRWTLNRKLAFLNSVLAYRAILRYHASPQNDVALIPFTDQDAIESERLLQRLRADHPEITDTMLDEWAVYGPSVTKDR